MRVVHRYVLPESAMGRANKVGLLMVHVPFLTGALRKPSLARTWKLSSENEWNETRAFFYKQEETGLQENGGPIVPVMLLRWG
jgi:hypothetical protein